MRETPFHNDPPSLRRKILLVDDHAVVRQGLLLLLGREPDLEVCGEAEDVQEGLALAKQTRPDAAVVDLKLRNSNGLDLIHQLREHCPNVKILVLSMRDEAFYAQRVLQAGAMGYVTKDDNPGRILQALRDILDGKPHLSPQLAEAVMGQLVGTNEQNPMSSLSNRELEIFELIGQGLPTRDIASRLHISPKTVDSHREHIKQKLDLHSATDLIKHAVHWVQYQKG